MYRDALRLAFAVVLGLGAGLPSGAGASEPPARKIVFLAGKKSHGPGAHEYEKDVKLLSHGLDTSPNVKGVKTEAHFNGWPADPATLDTADTIALLSDGLDKQYPIEQHPFLKGDHLAVVERQLKRGCGLVVIHWPLWVPGKIGQEKFVPWLGGFCDYENPPPAGMSDPVDWSRQPEHPICRGLVPFTFQDEYYGNVRFRGADPRFTPILPFPGKSKERVWAWAWQRDDGGRSFAFIGGHSHANWQIDPLRKAILNAILWTAKAEIPAGGAASTVEAKPAAAIFKPDAPGWATHEQGYGGPASGNWSSALAGEASWSDYRVDCRLALVKPADRRDGMELGAFVAFANHAHLGGYEAGLILRYHSPQKFYRVAVSSLWKEVILWRPSGGVLQAVDFPFEAGKTYHLTAECRGPRIIVQVDGKPLIDWWDTADPIASGKAGLARKEGESYFAAVKIDPLEAPAGKAPVHAPQFCERAWHNLRFFFDGNEPIFTLKDDNYLDLMKLRPGYRPILYTANFVHDNVLLSANKVDRCRRVKDGPQLVVETTGADPQGKSPATCDTRLVVTYDAGANLYTYDQTCTTHIPDEAAGKAGSVWDHGDPVFLGGVGGANTRDPNCPKPTYRWSVFQATDGAFYKVPLNHNLFFDGIGETGGGPFKASGFGMVVVGDPLLSPVVRVPDRSANFEDKNGFAHCWWAYDIHIGFYPKMTPGSGPACHAMVERLGRGGFYPPTVNGSVPPGNYVSRVVYTGMNAAAAREILAKARFYKPHNLNVKIPVYTAGIGFVEPFDKIVPLASPHPEHRIWAGVIDGQVGHNDRSSLRLDGPTEAWTQTGGSYFTGGYAKKIRVSGWVKTRNVQGEGPAIGFRRFDNRNAFEFHATGITGTTDWRPFSYVTAFPAECWGVTLYWRNSGTGTVWFDDFKIEPVEDAAVVTARNYPIRPADPDVVLKWDGQGDARGVLDTSGYGSHGKFYDRAAWVDEGGKRVIELRGKSSYIWPLSSPNLTFAPPATLVIRLKPEAPGNLLFWDFNYHLIGSGPKFGIGYQLNTLHGKPRGLSDPMVASAPFLQAGKWQTLAIVAADHRIKLYCDGKLVETLAAELKAGNWGPLTMDDGQGVHRRLSLFGSGPGDALMLASDEIPPTGGGLKGRIARLIVYRRALGEQEIAKLADPPSDHPRQRLGDMPVCLLKILEK